MLMSDWSSDVFSSDLSRCQWAVPLVHVIPGIRTFVSIPAGIFKMPLLRFILLTLIGAGSWTAALAIGGYALGGFEQIDRYIGPATTVIISALLGWYIFRVVTLDRKSTRLNSSH